MYFFINVQSSECITYFFSYVYLINCTFLSFSCLNCLTNESCMLVFISGFRSYAKILYNELLTATTMGNPKGCRNFFALSVGLRCYLKVRNTNMGLQYCLGIRVTVLVIECRIYQQQTTLGKHAASCAQLFCHSKRTWIINESFTLMVCIYCLR